MFLRVIEKAVSVNELIKEIDNDIETCKRELRDTKDKTSYNIGYYEGIKVILEHYKKDLKRAV